jgi:hypothetical protein
MSLNVFITICNIASAVFALVAAFFWYKASSYPSEIIDCGTFEEEPQKNEPNFFDSMRKSACNNSRGALAAFVAALMQGFCIVMGLMI